MRIFSESVRFREVQKWTKTFPFWETTINLAIWTFSDLKKTKYYGKIKVFDKVLGNFVNLYLRNAIETNHEGGLGRFEEVQNLPLLKKVLFQKLENILFWGFL